MASGKGGHPKSSTDEGTTQPSRRSTRANKGEGGVADQLAKVGAQIEPVKKRKKSAQDSIPVDEAQNPMAPAETHTKKRRKNKTTVNNVQVLQSTSMIPTRSVATAATLPPPRSPPAAPPASQLRLSPLSFVPPVPIDDPSRYGTLSATHLFANDNHDKDQSSSGSGSDDDSSSSSGDNGSDSEKSREDFEISDGEDERNAMAVVRSLPSAIPPPYERVTMMDPNIDPALQVQSVPIPKKSRKKSKENKQAEPRGSERVQASTDQLTDIVEDHRTRNPQPRLPNTANLQWSREGLERHIRELGERRRTGQIPSVIINVSSSSESPEGSSSVSSESVAPSRKKTSHSRRASRNSINPPTEDNATPVMLRYYKSEWQAVLKNAKNLYRFWLATENAYPTSAEGYHEADESIQEAIAEFKLEGGILENSDPVVTTDMRKMLYNESSAYRSFVKGIARGLVKDQYNLYPNANDSTAPSTAEGVKTFVRNRVVELTSNMQFVYGPLDEKGNVTNFAHPAIAAISSACFYSRPEQLGILYPGEFGSTIPTPALSLVVTAIKASLDEYATGVFISAKFDSEIHCKVYEMMAANLDAVLVHPYHGPALKGTVSRWARTASSRTNVFDPDLIAGPGKLFVDLTVV